jgi:hypothetical protein
MRKLLFLVGVLLSIESLAQQGLQLKWGAQEFHLDSVFQLNDTIQIRINQFKCYLQGNESPSEIQLIDAADITSLNWPKPYNKLQLGLAAQLHTSSNFRDQLDPIYGMYWSWNTGYVALKCSGELIYTKNQKVQAFELHLGGYQAPFACIYPIPGKGSLLQFDLYQWLHNIPPTILSNLHIMLPGEQSLHFFQQFYPAIRYVE